MSKRSFSFQNCFLVALFKTLISFSLLKPFDTTTTTAAFFNFNLYTTTLEPRITGFTVTGSGDFGSSVRTAGDVNNDGFDDIIIGAPTQNGNRGAVYVIYGGETSSFLNINLFSTPLDPLTTGFVIKGAANDKLGWSVSAAGDINKDGYGDIIIGVNMKNSLTGVAYIIYGGEKSSMTHIDLSITTLDPATRGFKISGISGDSTNNFGSLVSSAGDFNNDGFDDIIIGIPWKNNYDGAAYVIYGREKSLMSNIDLSMTPLDPPTTGFMITGVHTAYWFGNSVNTAGDINKDGYNDIIVRDTGRWAVHVIYGRKKSETSNLNLATTILDPATTGFMMTGVEFPDALGSPVSTAGDINKDGYDDIIIGAFMANGLTGTVYVIYGGEKSSLSNIDLSMGTLDPETTGFMILGQPSSGQFGWSVSAAGDLNKDGFNDIIIGTSVGTSYVIYGGKKSSMSNIDLSLTTLDPSTTGFVIESPGIPVSTAGDVNGDGYDDIILGDYGRIHVIHTVCSPCWDCPTNCNQCNSSPSLCLECSSPSLLYDSQCIASCPTATFPSAKTCKECPPLCSSCTSQTSCEVCDPGYTLSNSLCIIPSLQAGAKALQAVLSVSQGVGSLVCVGSATFPLTTLVSKVVQNTRYLNLSVTNELADIYQTWDTDLISWQVPNGFSRLDRFKASPVLFSRYEIDSPFLVNFWPTLITIGVGWAVCVALFGLQKGFERTGFHKAWIYSLLKKLVMGSFNFALVQTYGCLDDILFYLALDVKTNPFGSFFSWVSVISAFALMIIGCLLIFFNFWTVKKYQTLKTQDLAEKSRKDLKAFDEKNKYWELFYSDFNDDNFWSQSFLPLIIIRSSLSSLIIAALYDVVIFQTTSLLILDGTVLLFLLSKKPFKTLRGKIAQYYFEIITLLVHLCTFLLSLNRSSEGLKDFFSGAIIYLNTALVSGSTGFMFIEIYETIKEKAKNKKDDNVPLRTAAASAAIEEETLNTQNNNLTETKPMKLSGVKGPRRLNKANDEEEESENPISGLNIQRLDSNFNAENSLISDMNTSHLPSARRDQSSLSIMIKRRSLNLKQQQQQRERSMIKNHDMDFESLEEN